jgi:hypothetical protein
MFTPLEAINRLCDKREIFYDEMVDLMRQVMEGKVPPVQLAAILMGLHVKTESVSEIAAAAVMQGSRPGGYRRGRLPRRHLRHERHKALSSTSDRPAFGAAAGRAWRRARRALGVVAVGQRRVLQG